MNVVAEIESASTDQPEGLKVRLPLGLLGFEQTKEYSLIADPAIEPFLWLQAADDPNLAFLVLSPFEVVPDYQPDLSREDLEFLGLEGPDESQVLSIVTLRRSGGATVNLIFNLIASNFGGQRVSLFLSPLWFLSTIVLFGAFVGFLTGIIPASKAAKTDALEALRYK